MSEDAREPQTCTLRVNPAPPMTGKRQALITFVATGAFTGYTPLAPGSAGSVLGLLLAKFAAAPLWRHLPAGSLILFGVVFILSCGIADRAERIFGQPDSPMIVLDEVLGMIATMFGNPAGWTWLIVGFSLFRVFDIIKPWPASWFDKMQGGAGLMLDDLAAAVYANITLQVLRRLI